MVMVLLWRNVFFCFFYAKKAYYSMHATMLNVASVIRASFMYYLRTLGSCRLYHYMYVYICWVSLCARVYYE